jgi:hypothetical protein
VQMTAGDIERFLQAFFAPPNRITLAMVETDPRLAVFAGYLQDLRSLSEPSIVLPCWKGQGQAQYYGMAFSEREFRQLGFDLESFIGCSYSTLARRRSEPDPDDATGKAAWNFSSGYVYKFDSDPKDRGGAKHITGKLALMRDLRSQRQVRRPRWHLSLHMLLRDYYMAAEAENRAGAEKAIEAIRADGLLDAVNLLFLRAFLICRFGSLEELESSGFVADLLSIPRPVGLTDALISLTYRDELAGFEEPPDVAAAVERLKDRLLPVYGDLYRTWHGLRSAEAAKSFMLVAAASGPPDSALRDAILARKHEFRADDREWLETVAATFPPSVSPPNPPRPPTLDALVESALSGPPSADIVRALCRFAAFADTLEIREAIRSRYAQLTPEARQQLRSTNIAAAVLDDLMEPPVGGVPGAIPQNWGEWFAILKRTPHWPRASEFARKGSSEWLLVDGQQDPEALTQLLLSVQDRAELRMAFPHLIASARLDGLWPRSDWRVFYEAMMDILTSYTEGSVDDLIVWLELVEVILQLGVNRMRYDQICADARDLWIAYASAATVDWATDALDTLLFYPCQDDRARLDLFIAIASRAHAFKRLLEPRQLAFLKILAADFCQPEWATTFSDEAAGREAGTSSFAALAGKMVAIYTLTERVSKRVKVLLRSLCPDVDVRTNSDHVGTPNLKKLARDADIFIVSTASAKHAATSFISANRPAKAVTLFHNTRGSQSMIIQLQQYLAALTG